MEGSKDNFQTVSIVFLCFLSQKILTQLSYASLYFVCGVDRGDNELITLEVSFLPLHSHEFWFSLYSAQVIHEFVEALDRYFGNVLRARQFSFFLRDFLQVCELDLIFNFHKAYYILDEVLLCGEQQETSKKIVLRVIAAQV